MISWESLVSSVFLAFLGFALRRAYTSYIARRRFAIALLTEITVLLRLYSYKRKEGPPFQLIEKKAKDGTTNYVRGKMLVTESFLIIYDHNSDKLGLFDKKTIEALVQLYAMIRGHICSIKTWNEEFQTYSETEREEIQRYAGVLQKEYETVEIQVSGVKKILEKIISESFKCYLWRELCKFFKDI